MSLALEVDSVQVVPLGEFQPQGGRMQYEVATLH